jgi:hypothetical protein
MKTRTVSCANTEYVWGVWARVRCMSTCEVCEHVWGVWARVRRVSTSEACEHEWGVWAWVSCVRCVSTCEVLWARGRCYEHVWGVMSTWEVYEHVRAVWACVRYGIWPNVLSRTNMGGGGGVSCAAWSCVGRVARLASCWRLLSSSCRNSCLLAWFSTMLLFTYGDTPVSSRGYLHKFLDG